ncbi:hypothetical protein GmHk_02G004923 [Glycine max]|nr:hypothetical protein GmHk_02G004923 [Glycine max]
MMDYVSIKIVTCLSNFTSQNYPTHVMKLFSEDHMDFPCLFNDEYENWDVQGNIQYQYSLMRAQTQECGLLVIFSTRLNIQKTYKGFLSLGFIIFYIFLNVKTYSVHSRSTIYLSNLIIPFDYSDIHYLDF